ncbi:MAG: hypothetical protein NTZ13_02175 [Candidatus Parcubacteria bacterium]|nr:hypothetical protein [Candidatus Parcubacteria bacterium]
MKTPETCLSCNKLYLKNQNDVGKLCSECVLDESMHEYLQALRKIERRLTFVEWLFVLAKG